MPATRNRITATTVILILVTGLLLTTLRQETDPSNESPTSNHQTTDIELKNRPNAVADLPLSITEGDSLGVEDDNTFDCPDPYSRTPLEPENISALLGNSTDPEHLLVAALIGPDRRIAPNIDAMARALNAAPNSPLIVWNFLDLCLQTPDSPVCENQTMEKRAISVDGSNGQVWAKIAAARLKRHENHAALEALTKASTAPRFNEYWIEHIELFERGLAAASNPPYGYRILRAAGFAAGLATPAVPIIEACFAQAAVSNDWLKACLQFGERLEFDGRTILSKNMGLAIQKKMYSISGHEELASAAETRSRVIDELAGKAHSTDANILLSNDDNLMANYLSEFKAAGEVGALQLLKSEVKRLRKIPGYNPCHR